MYNARIHIRRVTVRAFIYCRVSTQEQATDDHYSLANQEARCRDYIKHRAWQLVKVLKDVGSGKSAERPNYQELLLAIREQRVDVVVVYRLDRLSRNVVDVYSALDAFSRNNVGFVSVQEAFDTTTAMGRAMLGVAAVFAQLTREMISENTRDGLARRAQSGKWTGSPRSRPYGYEYHDGGLHIVPSEAEVLRRIFRLYAEHGWGTNRIVQLLNNEGIPTATGLTGRWGMVVVSKILRNPVYAGRIRSGTKEFPGEHEAIVSAELFASAQDLMKQRAGMGPRGKSSPHLLSGIAKCGACGRNLTVHHTPNKNGGVPYVSYRHKTLITGDKCLAIQKVAWRLEALVVEQVRKLAATPDLRQAVLTAAREELAGQGKPRSTERDDLLRKLADGEAGFDKWVDRLDRGVIAEDQFAKLNEAHLAERQKLRERLAELEREAERAVDVEILIAEVEKLLGTFSATWEAMSQDEQRETIRSLVEYLKVYEDHMDLKLVFTPVVRLGFDFPRGRRSKAKTVGTGGA
jgi:site-specific DNA recombinase